MKLTAYTEPRFAPLPPKATPGRGTIDWKALGAQLEANPGQWAAIGTTSADGSLGNRGVRLRERGIDTTTRSNGDGTATVWACYVGVGQTAPPVQRTRRHGPKRRSHGDPLARIFGTADVTPIVGPLVWGAP